MAWLHCSAVLIWEGRLYGVTSEGEAAISARKQRAHKSLSITGHDVQDNAVIQEIPTLCRRRGFVLSHASASQEVAKAQEKDAQSSAEQRRAEQGFGTGPEQGEAPRGTPAPHEHPEISKPQAIRGVAFISVGRNLEEQTATWASS